MAFPASLRPTREWPLLILALALVCAICIPLWQWNSAEQPDDNPARFTLTAKSFAHLRTDGIPESAVAKLEKLKGQEFSPQESFLEAVAKVIPAEQMKSFEAALLKRAANPTPTKWSPERLGRLFLGPEQIACYACFVWASFILLGRYMEVRRQQRAFQLDLLPPGQCILVEDSRDLQRRIDERVGRGGPYILASMLRLALGKFATSRDGREVADIVRTQADVDLGRLVSSMATVHYLAWAIPSIGFLGTVRGLAGSLSLGGESKRAIADFIREATGHLNVAFDCTLIALALSLVLMFLLHSVQREEEGLVIDCQQYSLEHLVSRLYELEPENVDHLGELGASPASAHRTPDTGRLVT